MFRNAGQQFHLLTVVKRRALETFGGDHLRQIDVMPDGGEFFGDLLEVSALQAVQKLLRRLAGESIERFLVHTASYRSGAANHREFAEPRR